MDNKNCFIEPNECPKPFQSLDWLINLKIKEKIIPDKLDLDFFEKLRYKENQNNNKFENVEKSYKSDIFEDVIVAQNETENNDVFSMKEEAYTCTPKNEISKDISDIKNITCENNKHENMNKKNIEEPDSFTSGTIENGLLKSVNKTELDYKNDRNLKPPYSYATLIKMAIKSQKNQNVTLSDIYNWIQTNFAFYRYGSTCWQNSVRHNLSLNKCFRKCPKSNGDRGKGGYWKYIDTDSKPANKYSSKINRKKKKIELSYNESFRFQPFREICEDIATKTSNGNQTINTNPNFNSFNNSYASNRYGDISLSTNLDSFTHNSHYNKNENYKIETFGNFSEGSYENVQRDYNNLFNYQNNYISSSLNYYNSNNQLTGINNDNFSNKLSTFDDIYVSHYSNNLSKNQYISQNCNENQLSGASYSASGPFLSACYLDINLVPNINSAPKPSSDSNVSSFSDLRNVSNMNNFSDLHNVSNMNNFSDLHNVSNMNNFSDLRNVSNMNNFSDIANVPDINNFSSIANVPDINSFSSIANVSDTNNFSSIANVPDINNFSNIAHVADMNNFSSIANMPDIANVPNSINTPSITNVPNTTNTPSITNMSNKTNTPGITNVSNTTNTPSIANVPNATNGSSFVSVLDTDEVPNINGVIFNENKAAYNQVQTECSYEEKDTKEENNVNPILRAVQQHNLGVIKDAFKDMDENEPQNLEINAKSVAVNSGNFINLSEDVEVSNNRICVGKNNVAGNGATESSYLNNDSCFTNREMSKFLNCSSSNTNCSADFNESSLNIDSVLCESNCNLEKIYSQEYKKLHTNEFKNAPSKEVENCLTTTLGSNLNSSSDLTQNYSHAFHQP